MPNDFNDRRSYPVSRKATLSVTLNSLLENKSLSDVIFCVEGEYIAAHGFLLAVRSDVFQAMFFGAVGATGKVIHIDDISVNTFKQMLLYIYTDEINILSQNVIEIMYTAHKYNLTYLEEMCEEYIDENMCASNVLTTYNKLCKVDAFLSLKTKLTAFICEYFYDELSDPECLTAIDSINLIKDLLEKLVAIKHDYDHGRFEYDLFEMLIQWAKMKCKEIGLPERAENIRDCLEGAEMSINFENMAAPLLHQTFNLCPGFFTKDEICKFLMDDKAAPDLVYKRNNKYNAFDPNTTVFAFKQMTPQDLLNQGKIRCLTIAPNNE